MISAERHSNRREEIKKLVSFSGDGIESLHQGSEEGAEVFL